MAPVLTEINFHQPDEWWFRMRFNLIKEKEYDFSFAWSYEATFTLTIYISCSQNMGEITYT